MEQQYPKGPCDNILCGCKYDFDKEGFVCQAPHLIQPRQETVVTMDMSHRTVHWFESGGIYGPDALREMGYTEEYITEQMKRQAAKH